ncbi:type VII secretion protein EccCa [Catellatospora tritici]|uniref:type VII secretion protein EccCa n=1 Tax=Catellatospora tritici TaxID=2851566 RepID=UPI0027E1CAC2|nr:type VII secretion protein EccCa [Catellatospora tritici]
MQLKPPIELAVQGPRGLGQMFTVVPTLSGVGAMLLMMTSGGSGGGSRMWIAAIVFGVSLVGVVVGVVAGSGRRAQLDHLRREYLRHLGQSRRVVERSAQEQLAALRWRHPEPSGLWSLVPAGRLWECRADDPDFLHARVSVGTLNSAARLVRPEMKPLEDLEPLSAIALGRFLRAHSRVSGLPIAIDVKAFDRIQVRGAAEGATALVRAVVCQLAAFHSPAELRVAAVVSDKRREQWDWLKWLPHALHPGDLDAAGPVRLVVESLSALEELLVEDLAGREGHGGVLLPHTVVIVDGGDAPSTALLRRRPMSGVTRIDLSGVLVRDAGKVLSLQVAADGSLNRLQDDVATPQGAADGLSRTAASAVARQISPFRLVEQDGPVMASAVSSDLPAMLGIGDLEALDTRVTWRARSDRDRLRIPIGLTPEGELLFLDLKESAHHGMGPHGILIGGTGSGKSELLRTIVTALAATHSPTDLNFVLVDFKGGATFAGMEVLQHTSATITNLASELALVERMSDAVLGELDRRQEVLRKKVNGVADYASRYDYERARRQGAQLAPLPSLMIICDEFTELLKARPEFLDIFIKIGAIGRALGVHLLLATQKMEEGRLRGLDSYLGYRIGLRTDKPEDSRAVLGSPIANELPGEGGHGYLKPDATSLLRFRGGYISGPFRRPRALATPSEVASAGQHVVRYESAPVSAPQPAADPGLGGEPGFESAGAEPAVDQQITVYEMFLRRLRGQGQPAHAVWLPPLVTPPTLDGLLGGLAVDPRRGLCAATGGNLVIPIGIEDRPKEQRNDPLLLNLDGVGGNVLIVGGPQSGKTNLVRTMVAALALTHTPQEVQVFCLDFGGGGLLPLRDLPHVSGVAGRRDIDAVRRTVDEVTAIIDEREAVFAERGIDSMATWRRLRASGEVSDDPFGDVFLFVDGWFVLRDQFEAQEAAITELAGRGFNFGIHVIVTALRYVDVRAGLRELLPKRLELRLGDPTDSEIDRRVAPNVPLDRPGRGLAAGPYHYLTALPRVDGDQRADTVGDGLADLVARVGAAWTGPVARRVRMLPAVLPVAELHQAVDKTMTGTPIGINERRLAPVLLDSGQDPHLLIFGDSGCGKTNLLRHLIRETTERNQRDPRLSNTRAPRTAKLVVIDIKRSLLEFAQDQYMLRYLTSVGDIPGAVADLAEIMEERLPPADVTPTQLRDRSWWRGSAVHLVVDDYDLVAPGSLSPLAPLTRYLQQGADIGFHVTLARRASGGGRAVGEALVNQMRLMESPTLLMSGNPDELPFIGKLRNGPLPAGRARFTSRAGGTQLIQTVWREPQELL